MQTRPLTESAIKKRMSAINKIQPKLDQDKGPTFKRKEPQQKQQQQQQQQKQIQKNQVKLHNDDSSETDSFRTGCCSLLKGYRKDNYRITQKPKRQQYILPPDPPQPLPPSPPIPQFLKSKSSTISFKKRSTETVSSEIFTPEETPKFHGDTTTEIESSDIEIEATGLIDKKVGTSLSELEDEEEEIEKKDEIPILNITNDEIPIMKTIKSTEEKGTITYYKKPIDIKPIRKIENRPLKRNSRQDEFRLHGYKDAKRIRETIKNKFMKKYNDNLCDFELYKHYCGHYMSTPNICIKYCNENFNKKYYNGLNADCKPCQTIPSCLPFFR